MHEYPDKLAAPGEIRDLKSVGGRTLALQANDYCSVSSPTPKFWLLWVLMLERNCFLVQCMRLIASMPESVRRDANV